MKFNRLNWMIDRRSLIIIALGCTVSLLFYIIKSAFIYRIGFPLDDAWIHQTYARNLVNGGEWAFIPGTPSAGSTSPIWSFFLSVGYLVSDIPLIWTFFLGYILLFLLSTLSEIIIRTEFENYKFSIPWMGLLILSEWHMVWAAGSGMETLLFTIFVTFILYLFIYQLSNYFIIGLLIGFSIWIRIEGLTLMVPIILGVFLGEKNKKNIFNSVMKLIFGFTLFLLLYFLFNYLIEGSILPNPFYAKRSEYQVLQLKPLFGRFVEQLLQPLIGVGIIILPGFIYKLYKSIVQRRWKVVLVFLWLFGFAAMYAIQLPVVYQHGRYMMPLIPLIIIFGFMALLEINFRDKLSKFLFIITRTWVISLITVSLVFWFIGSNAYSTDVAIIESEMVEIAKWATDFLPEDSLIAAHDIGALGYFSRHDLLDLAGLVSPEVIPIIRDEELLINYLNQQEIDYLIVFPDWYPNIILQAQLLHESGGEFAPALGEGNLSVYKWLTSK